MMTTHLGMGDTVFADMTADQQAAWLEGQAADQSGGVPFSQMTAAQQAAFLNQSDFNALSTAQQTALLNTLSAAGLPSTGANNNIISGIPNTYLYIGGATLLVLVLLGSKR
jgi:hypothetical protein